MIYRDYYHGQAITVSEYLSNFGLSKNKINALIRNNCIFINESVADGNTIIYRNDDIKIEYNTIDNEGNINSEVGDLKNSLIVLYEDAYILIVDKPSNMLIYDLDNPNTVTLDILVKKYYDENGLECKVRHVHRLDMETTGCVVYAKDPITHSALSKMIEDNTLVRGYVGICEGEFINDQGVINENIGRDRHNAKKMIVSKTGKSALTNYLVISKTSKFSVVEFILKTGRTHQIRVHTSYLKHPLVGDKLYNNKQYNNKRCLLHSYFVEFVHPVTKDKVYVKASVPNDMIGYFEKRK